MVKNFGLVAFDLFLGLDSQVYWIWDTLTFLED